MLHLLKLMKNIGMPLCIKVTSLLILFQFLPNFLFLIWDPTQGSNLDILSCLIKLLIAMAVSQTFLDFHNLGNFMVRYFIEYSQIEICLDDFLMVRFLDGRSQGSSDILIILHPRCILSTKCIAVNVDLDDRAEGGLVRFPHCKITLSFCSHTFPL